MTTTFNSQGNDLHAASFWADLEIAMMAKTLAEAANLPDENHKDLLRVWMHGSFNGHAAGVVRDDDKTGLLRWTEDGTLRHLTYHAASGLACHLARAYLQPDGSWACLVVAGVCRDEFEAMARAEWAISRLTG